MTQKSGRILIADDDLAIRQALFSTLSAFGFQIVLARNGEEAVSAASTGRFDTLLLDVNMPVLGGIEACRLVRHLHPSLPLIMLSVRNQKEDIVKALDAGADDYITKPFDFRELMARLRSAVRRSRLLHTSSELFIAGDLQLDPLHRTLKKTGTPIHLTPKEFDLLQYLMSHSGVPIPHARLLQCVWGAEYGNEAEYLRTFVRQLRLKIEDTPATPTYLLTEPYIGYRFRECQNTDAS
jgi:two-component system KDP operon response regulator KdpE